MKSISRILSPIALSLLLFGCSKPALSNEQLLRNAYLDVIEASEEKIRPLVNLTLGEEKVTWNKQKDRVLLFTFHRYPDSYPEGQEITFTWGESWLCSVKEYERWYLDNKADIEDPLLRTKQLLGMAWDSPNTYISSMWFNPSDVQRPAYVTDPTKPMKLTFEDDVTEDYKNWFASQYYYSYEVKHLPWTRLGYTYDWSSSAKDRYGLSEFIAWKGTSVTVDKTMSVADFVSTFVKAVNIQRKCHIGSFSENVTFWLASDHGFFLFSWPQAKLFASGFQGRALYAEKIRFSERPLVG